MLDGTNRESTTCATRDDKNSNLNLSTISVECDPLGLPEVGGGVCVRMRLLVTESLLSACSRVCVRVLLQATRPGACRQATQ